MTPEEARRILNDIRNAIVPDAFDDLAALERSIGELEQRADAREG